MISRSSSAPYGSTCRPREWTIAGIDAPALPIHVRKILIRNEGWRGKGGGGRGEGGGGEEEQGLYLDIPVRDLGISEIADDLGDCIAT